MPGEVICIIGMHRSGTSMVAGLLQKAGLYLGPEDRLLGANTSNAEGHFEHTGILEINDALLEHLGGSWDLPPRMEPGWELADSLAEIRTKAQRLVDSFTGHAPWGWKEPRTTILLPFWNSIVGQPRFIICVRSPLDVAKSLARRDQMTIEHGAQLWSRYLRAAIQDTEGYPRHFAFYEDFFGHDELAARRLLKFCGLEAGDNSPAFEGGIRSDLRHHNSHFSALLDESSVHLHSKLLYLGLRAVSVAAADSSELGGGESNSIGRYLGRLDEFHNQGELGQLKTALTEKQYELSSLRMEKDKEIEILQRQLALLQERADRLQRFSDSVRGTLAYRMYRRLIRPLITPWRGQRKTPSLVK